MAETMRSPYEQFRALRSSTRISRQAWSQAADLTRALWRWRGRSDHCGLQPQRPHRPHRRYSWASTSVDEVRKVRKAFGGSFNDVVLAATAGAFRQLLLSRGESVERPVRSLVPVSVRTRDTSGRRSATAPWPQVSGMFADLPVGIEDPVERLAAVTSQMNYLKSSHEAVAAEALTSLGASRHRPSSPSAHGWRARHPRGAITPSRRTCLVPAATLRPRPSDAQGVPLCAARGSGPPRCGDLLLQRASQLRRHR